MADGNHISFTPTGRYSPLRYPGGKGKVARFIRSIIRANKLSDGHYVEPYAGGAAVAWELLQTGIVRRVTINDISIPIYSFWDSALNNTEKLCKLIVDTPLNVPEWDKQKEVLRHISQHDSLEIGFAFLYLNRTNRSGILNGGIIGGREQTGKWKIDARFNKLDIIDRIEKISALRSRVTLSQLDALEFINQNSEQWSSKTLVYFDPPYFDKGKYLYHNSYNSSDHSKVAKIVAQLTQTNWIVSYDDVRPIHDLYQHSKWLQYSLNYSARNKVRGREAMFFSDCLNIPDLPSPLREIDRADTREFRPVSKRSFAT
jgi:DNA adenine methylase